MDGLSGAGASKQVLRVLLGPKKSDNMVTKALMGQALE